MAKMPQQCSRCFQLSEPLSFYQKEGNFMNFTTNEKTGVSEGFCLIKTCDKKQTARGVPYLDLVLTDQSGEISAKLWDYKEEAQGSFAANDLVKVRGRIDVYNGADQLRIDRIRQVVPSDNVEMSDYVPSAAYDGAWMLSEIRSLVAAFENADLKELVTELLNEYEEQLLYWPAAFKLHHAIRGGLLCHTLSIVRLAQGVCTVYPFIDQELLLSGAILHDIAKIEEFTVSSTGIASGYTAQGMLIGHAAGNRDAGGAYAPLPPWGSGIWGRCAADVPGGGAALRA